MSSFQFYSREEYQSMSFNELVDYCLLLQEMAGAKDMECRSLTQRCADVEKKCKLLKKQNEDLTKENNELNERLAKVISTLNDKKAIIRTNSSEKYGPGNERIDGVAALLGISRDPDELDALLDELRIIAGEKAVQMARTIGARISEPVKDSTDNKTETSCDGHEDGTAATSKEANGSDIPASNAEKDSEENPGGNDETSPRQNRHRDGNPNLVREPGFMDKYCDRDIPVVFVIDDFTYTAEEVKQRLKLENLNDLAHLCSEIAVYETVNVIPSIALRTYHICLKLKHNVNDLNGTLWNQHFEKLFHGGSIASHSLISWIVSQKYVMGIPFYRIESELPKMGIHIRRSTYINWSIETAEMLKPLPRYMMRQLKNLFKVIHVDETYDSLSDDDKNGRNNTYFWMFRSAEKDKTNHPIAVFCFDKSRATIVPEYYLYDYTGRVLSDGYVCYKTLVDRNGSIIRCVCWIHGRRFVVRMFKGSDIEFREKLMKTGSAGQMETLDLQKLSELKEEDKLAMWGWIALLIIAALFRIEKKLGVLSAEERLRRRQSEMAGLIDQFFEMIDLVKRHPETAINDYAREALSYFDNNKEALREILRDGNVSLDNSAAERMAIDFAIGRNSWKAHDSVRGAEATALYYTLVETAKLNGTDPSIYIEYVLSSIRDIYHKYGDQLEKAELFEQKKLSRLESARQRLKEHPRKDPELDMTNLGEEPDLSFLECLMPWSDEFKEYIANRRNKMASYIADAVMKSSLENMKLRPEAFKRIISNDNGDDKRRPVKKMIRDAVDRLNPDFSKVEAAFEQQENSPVRDLILPKERKPFSFCCSKENVSGSCSSDAEKTSGKSDTGAASALIPEDTKYHWQESYAGLTEFAAVGTAPESFAEHDHCDNVSDTALEKVYVLERTCASMSTPDLPGQVFLSKEAGEFNSQKSAGTEVPVCRNSDEERKKPDMSGGPVCNQVQDKKRSREEVDLFA